MSDKETGTEWSHLLGKGMAGDLKDRTLDSVVSDMVTWSAWRQQHGETTVLDMTRTSREYSSGFYRDPDRFVFGFQVNGNAWALPMPAMLEKPVHSFVIDDRPLVATYDADGVVVRLFEARADARQLEFDAAKSRQMKDLQTGSIWDSTSGKCIEGPLSGAQLQQRVGIMSFRKAWLNFHPGSNDVKF